MKENANRNQAHPERPKTLNLNSKTPDFIASEKLIRIATQNIINEMKNQVQRNISGSNVNDSLDLRRVQPLKTVSKINFAAAENDTNLSPQGEILNLQQSIQSTPNINVYRQTNSARNAKFSSGLFRFEYYFSKYLAK